MEHYGEIPANNARLEELKRQIFTDRSELYLWVPPSKPYYKLEGVYKNSKGFSKILVFDKNLKFFKFCIIIQNNFLILIGSLSNS